MYKQGHRLRHPHQVLTNYAGVYSTNSEAHTLWEEALQYEEEKQEMDDTFRPKGDSEGMATQLGVAPIAFLNYRNAKNKLQELFVVGV